MQNLGADYDEAHDKWTYQGKTVMPQDTAKRLDSPAWAHPFGKKKNG